MLVAEAAGRPFQPLNKCGRHPKSAWSALQTPALFRLPAKKQRFLAMITVRKSMFLGQEQAEVVASSPKQTFICVQETACYVSQLDSVCSLRTHALQVLRAKIRASDRSHLLLRLMSCTRDTCPGKRKGWLNEPFQVASQPRAPT